MEAKDKIKKIDELLLILTKLKVDGNIIVTTNGSFDLLHKAHVHLLEKAKNFGSILIVLLNSDNSVRKNKEKEGKKSIRPYIDQNDRAYVIAGLESVNYVVIFDNEKPLEYLSLIKPNKHIKGGSGVIERYKEEKEFIENLGGEYIVMPLEEGYSSTNVEQIILEKNKFLLET